VCGCLSVCLSVVQTSCSSSDDVLDHSRFVTMWGQLQKRTLSEPVLLHRMRPSAPCSFAIGAPPPSVQLVTHKNANTDCRGAASSFCIGLHLFCFALVCWVTILREPYCPVLSRDDCMKPGAHCVWCDGSSEIQPFWDPFHSLPVLPAGIHNGSCFSRACTSKSDSYPYCFDLSTLQYPVEGTLPISCSDSVFWVAFSYAVWCFALVFAMTSVCCSDSAWLRMIAAGAATIVCFALTYVLHPRWSAVGLGFALLTFLVCLASRTRIGLSGASALLWTERVWHGCTLVPFILLVRTAVIAAPLPSGLPMYSGWMLLLALQFVWLRSWWLFRLVRDDHAKVGCRSAPFGLIILACATLLMLSFAAIIILIDVADDVAGHLLLSCWMVPVCRRSARCVHLVANQLLNRRSPQCPYRMDCVDSVYAVLCDSAHSCVVTRTADCVLSFWCIARRFDVLWSVSAKLGGPHSAVRSLLSCPLPLFPFCVIFAVLSLWFGSSLPVIAPSRIQLRRQLPSSH
jgi:hypothetical protein